MKITRIHIDRFGLWRDLDLPLHADGLTVFEGPNEAGKSTLLRFIRGMLYGFPRADVAAGDDAAACGGALEIETPAGPCRLQRRLQPGNGYRIVPHDGAATAEHPRQELAEGGLRLVDSASSESPAAESPFSIQSLLSGTSRIVFENVFAVGLHELQQLASLHADEVAQRLYGESLGSDGRRLIEALRQTAAAQRRLFDPSDGSGRLAEMLEKDRTLHDELRAAESLRDEYDRLTREGEQLAGLVRDMRKRQAGMEWQLRGHRFLQRVWRPWKQVRDYRAELDAVPELEHFPADGVQRLKELESEIDSERRCRQALRREIEQLRARGRELRAAAQNGREHRALRKLTRQRERCDRIAARLAAARQRAETLLQTFDQRCRELGDGWGEQRLHNVDGSPVAQFELLQTARKFHAALVRRGRFRAEYRRQSRAFRKLQQRIEERLRECDAGSVAEAVERQRERLEYNRRRSELERDVTLLERRRRDVRELLARPAAEEVFPVWFRRVLWCFGIAGACVAVSGILTAATFSALAGAVLSLSGLTGLGVAWGLQHHSDTSSVTATGRRQRELLELDTRIEAIRKELQQSQPQADGDADPETALENAAERLVELETLQRAERQLQARRQRLVRLRQRFASIRQEFGTARQDWCAMLSAVGLDESLTLKDAFQEWDGVLAAKELLAERHAAEMDVEGLRRRFDRARRRADELQARAGNGSCENAPDAIHETASADGPGAPAFDELARAEWRQLRQDLAARRKEEAGYKRRLRELQAEQEAILEQGGAGDVEEFQRRAKLFARRQETAELLQMAEEELREAAAAEPELAVVEEDLVAFDPDEHAECIRALEAELADLGRDLEQAHEELGGLRQAAETLQADRAQTVLRSRRHRLEQKLHGALAEWAAGRMLQLALEAVRARFEREHQPAVLTAASGIFEQMTGGRYRRLWTPLGRRRICADDDRGRTWDLDGLSGGTREQIFLSLRLALAGELSAQGVELPLVLDDVLVNCDARRTEAAVEALLNYSESGRQIVFLTCHRHIAEAFGRRGIAPIPLPEPQASERRLAG